MKKIVPFNNVLNFNTDVCEITAISLEHDININEDTISGTFFISGEYKITDGSIEREPFNFELPFDIALGANYKKDSIKIDIDDFRYELIEKNKLKVNIDLYIDGEEEPVLTEIPITHIEELNKPEEREEEITVNNEVNNIFKGFNEEEKYVTYRVYTVTEEDNLDKIIEKYNTTKEELAKYNIIDNIKPGDKLIIPANDK